MAVRGLLPFLALLAPLAAFGQESPPAANPAPVVAQAVPSAPVPATAPAAFAGRARVLAVPGGHMFYIRDASRVRLRDEGEALVQSAAAP